LFLYSSSSVFYLSIILCLNLTIWMSFHLCCLLHISKVYFTDYVNPSVFSQNRIDKHFSITHFVKFSYYFTILFKFWNMIWDFMSVQYILPDVQTTQEMCFSMPSMYKYRMNFLFEMIRSISSVSWIVVSRRTVLCHLFIFNLNS